MQDVGYAALQIIPSFKGLDRNLEAGTSKAMLAAGTRGGTRFGDAAGRSAGARFGTVFASAAKAGLVGVLGVGALAYKLGKDSIALASDQAESINAVNVTYEEQAKAVKKLGKEAADSLGLSRAEFNGLAVQFSAFAGKVAGGDGSKVVGVLDDLTTRGADFASVMNLDVNEAMGLFQSGLAGETEPLRRYGIDLSAAAVEAHGMKMGLTGVNDEFTEGEKVQARYSLLMQQTAKTQGDFANTSDSLANRQRILNARWDDARAKLGRALLPVMEDVAGFLVDTGLPAFERASDWFVDKGIPAISDFADDMRPLAESLLPAAGDALGIIADGAKTAAPYVKNLVDSLNEMPDWQKAAILGGGAALWAGKKLGITGGPGGGLLSGGVQKVWVMNPGFGVPTPGIPGSPTRPGAGPTKGGFFNNIKGLGAAVPGILAPALGAWGNDQFTGEPLPMPKDVINMDPARREMAEIQAMVKTLPSDLQFNMAITGVPESKKAAIELVDTYNLTPKEKRTLFEVAGIDTNKRTVNEYKGILGSVPERESTQFSIFGVESANAALDRAAAKLNALDGRTYKAIIQLHTVRTGAGGQGVGYDGSADGGTVPKTGMGYADRHPYLLADGEEVISNRYGQADRYRGLLKAINANRAADGVTVGRGASVQVQPAGLAGLRIEGQIELTDRGGYLRGVIAEEISADQRFQRTRPGGH